MDFKKFIGENHPDPDTLLLKNFEQMCILAEKYAESLQLSKADVIRRSKQLFTNCVVCGEKYQNPKNDSDTCYDCREPYCK